MATPTSHRVVIDLGCGFRKKPGAIGFDIARIPGVDVICDVMRPLPSAMTRSTRSRPPTSSNTSMT
ncbi:MAG: hypothetical protein M5U18_11795 [Dehalococcoidia bacterium]|nr:hypothetical protein [Dehalococcoidia bacterium]